MEKYKQEFIEFMIDCSVLRFGDFVTKSGRKTPFFVNTGFYRTGSQLSRLGEYYAHAIREAFGLDFEVLFGPAYKGIPLSVAASMAISRLYGKEIRYCSNRKEVKDHGDKVKAQGNVTPLGLVVSVDRMERGQGTKSALTEISENYGLKTTAIVTMEEVVEHLYLREYNGKVVIDEELKKRIDAYYDEYGVHCRRCQPCSGHCYDCCCCYDGSPADHPGCKASEE